MKNLEEIEMELVLTAQFNINFKKKKKVRAERKKNKSSKMLRPKVKLSGEKIDSALWEKWILKKKHTQT